MSNFQHKLGKLLLEKGRIAEGIDEAPRQFLGRCRICSGLSRKWSAIGNIQTGQK